jgi:CyaY protein
MTTLTDPGAAPALTDAEYHAKTSAVLAGIEACLDRWLQDDVIDIDAQRTGGLLELGFPNGSKIVLNTQPPLHELWMAARSGGFHYKHVAGQWRDREGREFFEALSACASEQAGKPLRFDSVSA